MQTLQEVLKEIATFPLEDQEYIAEMLSKRLQEAKRSQLLQRAKEAEENYRSGKVIIGTVKDLMVSLNDA